MDRPDICMLTNVHNPLDQRIFYKQARSLVRLGYSVVVVGPGERALCGERDGVRVETVPKPRSIAGRLLNLGRVFRAALRVNAQAYHFHDPELLPVGLLLRGAGHRAVYDVHEHFPQAVKVRPWVPDVLRSPLSWCVDQFERMLAKRLSGLLIHHANDAT